MGYSQYKGEKQRKRCISPLRHSHLKMEVPLLHRNGESVLGFLESERYIIRTKNVIEGRFIMSYPDLSVIAAGHEMPIGDDRAPVQTQAESRKNGRIARREAPDKSALYYIYGKNMHLLISTGE